WSHRLVAALVSVLVVALAVVDWWDGSRGRFVDPGPPPGVRTPAAAFAAVGLLVLQIVLGAITVKLELPAWSIVLHLGTAMLLLATLLVAARDSVGAQHAAPLHRSLLTLTLVTVLLGALTANLGAAAACH